MGPNKKHWCKHPNWQLFLNEKQLYLSAGGDAIYWVEEANTAQLANVVHQAWQNDVIDELAINPNCANVWRQLLRIGAVVSANHQCVFRNIALVWFGGANQELAHQLEMVLPNQLKLCHDLNDADMLLLIRSNASWQDVITKYQQLSLVKPHFWVDCAYQHTLVLGPYVVPHETACISCLANRIAHRWGDASLPDQPKVLQNIFLISTLIANQFVYAQENFWVNWIERITSMNLNTLTTESFTVYQMPHCSECQSQKMSSPIDLPWMSISDGV